MRKKYSGVLLLCTLLTALTAIPSNAFNILSHFGLAQYLERNSAVTWREVESAGTRCFEVDFPGRGVWGLELWTSAPASNPGIVFLPASMRTPELRFLGRTETLTVEVDRAGTVEFCATSMGLLDDAEIRSVFLPTKGGDPDETEIEPDPKP